MKQLIQREIVERGPLKGMQPPNTIREFKGLSTYDPFMIDQTYFTDTVNLVSDAYPAAEVRPGYSVLGSTTGKVLGLGVWKNQQLVGVWNDGTFRKWTGSTWTTVASGLDHSAKWTFSNFQGNQDDICLFGTNGMDGLMKYDGSTFVSFGDAPDDLNFITTYQNRLWGASGKEIHSSALDQPDQWNLFAGNDEDSFARPIESTAGEDINMLSGGLYRLTIGMPSSVTLLFGGVPSDFNTQLVTEDEGFASNGAAVTQQGTMRFMHKTGIYEYEASTNPDDSFSDIVKTYYPLITENSVAGTNGQRVYFFLEPDTILFYDPRPGITAWYVWRDIEATCFALMDNETYIGDSSGRVLRLGADTDDAGTPIAWKAVTKPFTSPSMSQRMKWIKAFITIDLAAGSTMNISLSQQATGDSDWTMVKTVTGTGINNERILIPLTGYQLAKIVRIKLEGTGYAKLHEITTNIRLLPLY